MSLFNNMGDPLPKKVYKSKLDTSNWKQSSLDSLNLYNLNMAVTKANKQEVYNLDRLTKSNTWDDKSTKLYSEKYYKAEDDLNEYRKKTNYTIFPHEPTIGYNYNIGYGNNGKTIINNSGISTFKTVWIKKTIGIQNTIKKRDIIKTIN